MPLMINFSDGHYLKNSHLFILINPNKNKKSKYIVKIASLFLTVTLKIKSVNKWIVSDMFNIYSLVTST